MSWVVLLSLVVMCAAIVLVGVVIAIAIFSYCV